MTFSLLDILADGMASDQARDMSGFLDVYRFSMLSSDCDFFLIMCTSVFSCEGIFLYECGYTQYPEKGILDIGL